MDAERRDAVSTVTGSTATVLLVVAICWLDAPHARALCWVGIVLAVIAALVHRRHPEAP